MYPVKMSYQLNKPEVDSCCDEYVPCLEYILKCTTPSENTGEFFMLMYNAYVGIEFGCECNKGSGQCLLPGRKTWRPILTIFG